MKHFLSILIILIIFSCEPKQTKEQVETLQMVIQEAEKDNMDLLMQMDMEVDVMGRKEEHLEVFAQARHIIDLRKEYDYQFNQVGNADIFHKDKLNEFLDTLNNAPRDTHINTDVINIKIEEYRERIMGLKDNDHNLKNYLILINLSYLEHDILWEYAKYFGHH